MRKSQRLRHRRDFAETYRTGQVYRDRLLVLRVRPNERPCSRFGFVAGKVVGKAVIRNRTKRRLRAAVDSLPVVAGLDIVIGARRPAADARYSDLRGTLERLLRRAGALEPATTASPEST